MRIRRRIFIAFLAALAALAVMTACGYSAPPPPPGTTAAGDIPPSPDDSGHPVATTPPTDGGGGGGTGPLFPPWPSVSSSVKTSATLKPPPNGALGGGVSIGALWICKDPPCREFDFGTVAVGSALTRTISVFKGDRQVFLTGVTVTGASFELVTGPTNTCIDQSRPPCSFQVRFRPRLRIDYVGKVEVTVTGGGASSDLFGRGACPSPCLPPPPPNHATTDPPIERSSSHTS